MSFSIFVRHLQSRWNICFLLPTVHFRDCYNSSEISQWHVLLFNDVSNTYINPNCNFCHLLPLLKKKKENKRNFKVLWAKMGLASLCYTYNKNLWHKALKIIWHYLALLIHKCWEITASANMTDLLPFISVHSMRSAEIVELRGEIYIQRYFGLSPFLLHRFSVWFSRVKNSDLTYIVISVQRWIFCFSTVQ